MRTCTHADIGTPSITYVTRIASGLLYHITKFRARRPAVPEIWKRMRTCALADVPHTWLVENALLMNI